MEEDDKVVGKEFLSPLKAQVNAKREANERQQKLMLLQYTLLWGLEKMWMLGSGTDQMDPIAMCALGAQRLG